MSDQCCNFVPTIDFKSNHSGMLQEIVVLEIPKRKLATGFAFSNVVGRERVAGQKTVFCQK